MEGAHLTLRRLHLAPQGGNLGHETIDLQVHSICAGWLGQGELLQLSLGLAQSGFCSPLGSHGRQLALQAGTAGAMSAELSHQGHLAALQAGSVLQHEASAAPPSFLGGQLLLLQAGRSSLQAVAATPSLRC